MNAARTLAEEATADRLVIADQDIVGEASQDYIVISLEETATMWIADDVDLHEPVIVGDDFAGFDGTVLVAEPAFDKVPGKDGGAAADEEDDAIRELAFTGDGV